MREGAENHMENEIFLARIHFQKLVNFWFNYFWSDMLVNNNILKLIRGINAFDVAV